MAEAKKIPSRIKVTTAFRGVIDGHVHPRLIEVDEIIEGDIAKVAFEEKWGVDADEKEPAKVNDGQKGAKGDGGKDGGTKADGDKKAVEIPGHWRTFKGSDLLKLAGEVAGELIQDAEKAIEIIAAAQAKAPK